MRCLCHLWSHVAYVLGWPMEWFETAQVERAAFDSCTANSEDAVALAQTLRGAEAHALAALFENPSVVEHFSEVDSIAGVIVSNEPLSIAAHAKLALAQRATPIDLLIPARGYARPHVEIRRSRLSLTVPHVFFRVTCEPELMVPTPALHLFLRARKLDALALALVISEYCGTYRSRPDLRAGHLTGAPQLINREFLRQFAAALPAHTYGRNQLKQGVDLAFDGSASPRETALAVLLSLPRRMGGAGLMRPILNAKVTLSPEASRLAGCDVIRPDFLWPEQRVCLEYQGADFHSGFVKAQSDNNRVAALEQDGYRCLQVTNQQVNTPQQFALLAGRIATLLSLPFKPLDQGNQTFLEAHRQIMSARFSW